MRVRIDMIVDAPDDNSFSEIENFVQDAVMYLAQDNDVDFDVMEFVDIYEM